MRGTGCCDPSPASLLQSMKMTSKVWVQSLTSWRYVYEMSPKCCVRELLPCPEAPNCAPLGCCSANAGLQKLRASALNHSVHQDD